MPLDFDPQLFHENLPLFQPAPKGRSFTYLGLEYDADRISPIGLKVIQETVNPQRQAEILSSQNLESQAREFNDALKDILRDWSPEELKHFEANMKAFNQALRQSGSLVKGVDTERIRKTIEAKEKLAGLKDIEMQELMPLKKSPSQIKEEIQFQYNQLYFHNQDVIKNLYAPGGPLHLEGQVQQIKNILLKKKEVPEELKKALRQKPDTGKVLSDVLLKQTQGWEEVFKLLQEVSHRDLPPLENLDEARARFNLPPRRKA